MRSEQTFHIFSIIRRDHGTNVLKTAGKFVNEWPSITKFYCHLNYNHSCSREKLLPKSLRFSPTICLNRGFELARKHGFEFLKLRITESHFNINKKKQLISEISIG